MHNTYRIMALNILAAVTSSVAMEQGTTSTNILSLPGVGAAAFVGNGLLVISSDSTALFPYKSDENPRLPCSLKEKTRKITNQQYGQFAVSNKGTIAGFSDTHCMIYHPEEDSLIEKSLVKGHRAIVFGNDDRLFVHIKDYRNENRKSVWKAIPEYDGKTLEEFNCDTDECRIHAIDYGNSSIPAIAFRSRQNEIVYASDDNSLSRISIHENGEVQKTGCIIIDSLIEPLIFGDMKCNSVGSAVVLSSIIPHGGLAFRIYDFEHNKTYQCGRCNGAAFHPIKPFIIALLRQNTVIEYCDIAMEDLVLIHSADPIVAGEKLPRSCNFTIEFSPDGMHLLVVLDRENPSSGVKDIAFLIPVPACVGAYKRMQEAQK